MPGLPIASPVQQFIKSQIVPAPNGGINAVDMLVATPNVDSIFQYNLIPQQYGCKVRAGLSTWASQVGTGGVNTIIPYNGGVSSADKLFCAGKNGLFDISANGTTNPAAIVTFGNIGTLSGYGGIAALSNPTGHYMTYCDELNGYYVFTEGGTWAKVTLGGGATQVSGVDPATFVWPCLFKKRLWFVQSGTTLAWFLGTEAVYGAATSFNFGSSFKHGGSLVALYTWTLDGGDGIDDYLVAISSSGDVAVFQGTDPTVATSFGLVGTWYIGPPPAYRRLAGSFGGDLYLLSSYGLLPLSKLIAGVLIQNQSEYISRKITPLIFSQMATQRGNLGWEVKLIPDQQLILMSVPAGFVTPPIQFVQSLNTQGWAIYRDIKYNTGDSWNGNFYIGDLTGNVYWHTGNTDNGLAINWSMLTSFQEYDEIGHYHRVQFIRPVFLALVSPSFSVKAKYDYDLTEVLSSGSASTIGGALWDSALWDVGLWGGGAVPISAVRGGSGLGRAMAIGLNGSSTSDTTLIRFDLMFDTGNLL